MIEIQRLFKYYGERRVLGPLELSIPQGQVVGLLGLNGAGKTTTLRILAGDLLPSSGQLRIDGVDALEHPQALRAKVGYLPDRPPLYEDQSVLEYLRFVARLRGYPRSKLTARLEAVAAQFELGEVLGQRVSALSHGFRQRVGIAQAVVHEPALVILDEPISGLDPVQIVEMRRFVRSLGGRQTVLISSHILTEIAETCDRILVIRGGEIVADGSEAELSSRLSAGRRFELTVRMPLAASPEGLTACLKQVDGVSDVELVPAREHGAELIGVRLASSGDPREALVVALVAAGYGLLELRRFERELEDVFLQLSEVPS